MLIHYQIQRAINMDYCPICSINVVIISVSARVDGAHSNNVVVDIEIKTP